MTTQTAAARLADCNVPNMGSKRYIDPSPSWGLLRYAEWISLIYIDPCRELESD